MTYTVMCVTQNDGIICETFTARKAALEFMSALETLLKIKPYMVVDDGNRMDQDLLASNLIKFLEV